MNFLALTALWAVTSTLWWTIGGVSGFIGLLAFVVLIGLLVAMGKKKVDKDEDACEQMAGIFQERLDWPEVANIFRKLGRFNLIGARNAVKQAWHTFGGSKIWGLITKFSLKCTPAVLHNVDHENGQDQRLQVARMIAKELPALMAAKDTGTIIDDAVFTEATGLALDAETKANLVAVASGLRDWGMDDTAVIVQNFIVDHPEMNKVVIQALANDLKTEEGRASRAKKVLRKLVPHMMEDAANAQWLKDLVNGPAPAATPKP